MLEFVWSGGIAECNQHEVSESFCFHLVCDFDVRKMFGKESVVYLVQADFFGSFLHCCFDRFDSLVVGNHCLVVIVVGHGAVRLNFHDDED